MYREEIIIIIIMYRRAQANPKFDFMTVILSDD